MSVFRLMSFCFAALFSVSSWSLETVHLQLKWKHQFQFAGYYAAFVKGYYKEVGLDVVIHEARYGEDPIDTVIAGDAQYGVGTSELLLKHAAGAPVVVLGVIFQHSPLALVADRNKQIAHVHDLVDVPLMIEPNSAELFAYLAQEGVSKDRLKILPHSFDIRDLIEGKVGGMSVYVTDEPYALREAGFDYILLKPSQGGIDFYGDNFFTTREELEKHPDRVRAFREATIKGWHYAMAHPEEIIDLIYERYTQRHSRLHLAYEAKQMMGLLQPELVEPGYMNAGRWRHIADTYAEQKLLPPNYDLGDFLYEQEKGIDVRQVQRWGATMLIITAIVVTILFYVSTLNRRLQRSQQWLKQLVENAPSAMIVLNENGEVLDWNDQAEHVFGWTIDEVKGLPIFDFLIPKSELEHVNRVLESVQRTGEVMPSQNWNLTKSGQRILCDWRNVKPQENYTICMAQDITERNKMEAKLREMAHTDALTKVANRTLFFEKFEQSILLAKRQGEKIAMLFIDLDDFKLVNDQYGHEVGDVVLCDVVQRIRMAVREADLLARIGGDEFVLMLYNCPGVDKARQVAEKVLQVLERPVKVAGVEVMIGGSIGISVYPEHGEHVSGLLKAADKAMYSVKTKSKNGIGIAGQLDSTTQSP
ncbi:MAG: diguanylate cyclase [Oleiphilaceae bacterium]|nr:diguanylate cyclase [Oleiphilaceae bacterium]